MAPECPEAATALNYGFFEWTGLTGELEKSLKLRHMQVLLAKMARTTALVGRVFTVGYSNREHEPW